MTISKSKTEYANLRISSSPPSSFSATAAYWNSTGSPGLPSDSSTTAYLPEIFHPGSSLSSLAATSAGMPTTTSDLIVLSERMGGAPASEAMGPMAMSKGVSGGAWQS